MNEREGDFAWLNQKSVEHLRDLTRRLFIGPIPTNFLSGSTGFWKKRFQNYSRHQASYDISVEPPINHELFQRLHTHVNRSVDEVSMSRIHSYASTTRPSMDQARPPLTSHRPNHRTRSSHVSKRDSFANSMHSNNRDSTLIPYSSDSARVRSSFDVQRPFTAVSNQTFQSRRSSDQRSLTSRRLRFSLKQSSPRVLGTNEHAKLSAPSSDIVFRTEEVLLRVETSSNLIPTEFNEMIASRIPRKTILSWAPCTVIAVKTSEKGTVRLDFIGEEYMKTVVDYISENEPNHKHYRKNCLFSLFLTPSYTFWNIYNSFDNSLAIWSPYIKHKTFIFLLNFQCTTSAYEWIAIVSRALDFTPGPSFLIGVPAFHIHLRLSFTCPNSPSVVNYHANSRQRNETALHIKNADSTDKVSPQTIHDTVLKNWEISETDFVNSCLNVLKLNPEWSQIVNQWFKTQSVGLCWRTYDRIEWITNVESLKYVGLLAAKDISQLELRPKNHYPSFVTFRNGSKMKEPVPFEGYLIRLTTSAGRRGRFGRLFHKKLYFTVFNHLFLSIEPSYVLPLTILMENFKKQMDFPFLHDSETNEHQSMFDPLKDVSETTPWFDNDIDSSTKEQLLALLQTERRRELDMLSSANGFLDLSKVELVKPEESGTDNNVFEVRMVNGMSLLFQSYNQKTRDIWIEKLGETARYWKQRLHLDLQEFYYVRDTNISILHIDSSIEPVVASHSNHWEVSECIASTHIHNYCNILGCRIIRAQGVLYMRTGNLYEKCYAILIPGRIIFFRDATRTKFGKLHRKTHFQKFTSIYFKNAYIYTGLTTITEFARDRRKNEGTSNRLPKCHEDGWKSFDKDEMLSFVIYSQNGLDYSITNAFPDVYNISSKTPNQKGNKFMFLARTRQERDVWVKRISREIERIPIDQA
ncbi:spore wall assembly protein [Schizosaccharomyces cryophilus OY26]|uniref:Spore wall assembly protein n=1 Tax=Schizosaccharomyces cryophilus (strain OY26 / ATCC MYA-4695 / CBS 11777 / NBRC 106824 / NRRL Y48691) TaxID=653667 RepID=S9VUH0_SCHCR|nr:spore wall assembly protein [Schizosaccharomyces cryophilus OY26]EPY51428.1 spore wall assembly protein [Schizosaccharomyces cryophilus OY26]